MIAPRLLAGAVLLAAAAPAVAQQRDYCPERPGLDTPPCVVDKGHVSVETALADWIRDDQPDARTDTVLVGDTLIRIGVSDRVEARIGWTPFGHVRVRDRASGAVARADRVGDVTLGAKVNLAHPSGDGLSLAVLPYVSLPVGRRPVGGGDWGAGLLVPVSYNLSDAVSVQATPELDAAVDDDGDGRHLSYSGTAGLAWGVTDSVTLTAEGQWLRDRAPDDHTTQMLAALSVGWMARPDLQFDLFGAAGLNHSAPDTELYAGVSRRF